MKTNSTYNGIVCKAQTGRNTLSHLQYFRGTHPFDAVKTIHHVINTQRKEVYTTLHGKTYVSFQYPDHYTQQQTGFTPAGGAKNHFPGVTTLRLTKVVSIEHANALKALAELKADRLKFKRKR